MERDEKSLRISLLCLISAVVIGTGPSPAFTFPAIRPLSEMVQKAEFIVIGEIVKMEKIGMTFSGGKVAEYRATIEVERTIKGDPSTKTLQIAAALDFSDSPPIAVGQRSVYFLYSSEGRLRILGMGGEIPITDDIIKPRWITGEPKEQELDEFLDRIRGYLAK